MEHITTSDFKINKPTSVVLGNFDGVHLGHKSLIDKAISESKNAAPTVLSFYPHPAHIINKNSNVKLITVRKEKAFVLKKIGIEIYIEYPFNDDFASLSAEEFAEKILFTQINCKTIIVGENYRFGKNRKGDICLLKSLAHKYSAKVISVPLLTKEDNTISSTLIRQYISSGYEINKAAKCLTYPYMTMGAVTETEKPYCTILSMTPCPIKLLPKDGVYLTGTYAGSMYDSITVIHSSNNLNTEEKTIETYLSNYTGKVADKEIIIYYYNYIGEEKTLTAEQYNKYFELTKNYTHTLTI